MADTLHSVINTARDEMKAKLMEQIVDLVNVKFAVLEGKIRDIMPSSLPQVATTNNDYMTKEQFENFEEKMCKILNQELQRTVEECKTIYKKIESQVKEPVKEVISVEKPSISKNLVIERKPISPKTESTEDGEGDSFCKSAGSEEADESDEEEPNFSPLVVDGTTYWLDASDHTVYKKTDEGYEEVGSFDPDTGEIEIEDEEQEESEKEGEVVEEEEQEESQEEEESQHEVEEESEEEEEAEVEEFSYKGKTYLRDSENTVYSEDGDVLGIWTGTVIKFTPRR